MRKSANISDFLMIYKIDGIITYNSDDCTLSHLETDESVSLSISAGRLLERLLNSEGEVLARNELLTEVWDKYGLRGSNSNLNQYLSLLRRALAAYGCDNLIITIPKIGIRINSEITLEKKQLPAMAEMVTGTGTGTGTGTVAIVPGDLPDGLMEDAALTEGEQQRAVKKPRFLQRNLYVAIIVLIVSAACGYYWWIVTPERKIASETIKLAGGCEVVLLKGLDDIERQPVIRQLLGIIKENNQPCVTSRRFYFDNNTSFTTSHYGRTMLSSCKINSHRDIITCDNFYYLDWRGV